MIEINRNPTRRQLRWFAGLVFPLFCAWVAWILYRRFAAPTAGAVLVGVGVVLGLIGLASVDFARRLWLGVMYAVFPIGFVISHLLLAVVYYLVLTPVGLALRLAGRDPLTRRSDPDATTYWIRRQGEPDVERYFRQY